MKVWVLRLGHRRGRDPRLTTHVALTARVLGCDGIILSGEKDDSIIENINEVVENWGNHFEVKYEKNWRNILNNWKGKTVHLTMYGLPIQDKIDKMRKLKNILIVVGSEKVPSNVYHLVDFNIAVTNQPHSEVGSLAIFLDKLFEGKNLEKKFKNARIKIIPQERGKKTISL
jgi:tRNA (cytidine56-2'-O)-methyltransferase